VIGDFSRASIYASLGAEMKLAMDATNSTYGTIVLHQQKVDAEHSNFQVALEPGPLTAMVSTAAVIAILELLKQAASLFGWTLETSLVDELLGEAQAVNETSARLDLIPSGSIHAGGR
jgi:hypothetical protein